MATTLTNCLDILSHHPLLLPPIHAALHGSADKFVSFLLDPSTDPDIILLYQQHGRDTILPPVFRLARAWIWAAHRTRLRLLGLPQMLL